MNKNNTNINEDIYNKFYSTLLFEIKKMIKKFRWRKASRKYRTNNKERFLEISNKLSKKYYHNTPGLREKILHYRKLRYQMDEDFRNKSNTARLNHYCLNKEEISKKAKLRYQLRKNKANNNLEINNNIVTSF